MSQYDFADAVKQRARELRMNLDSVAAQIGVATPTFRSWLYSRRMTKDAFTALCRVLQWSGDVETMGQSHQVKWARPRAFTKGPGVLSTDAMAGDLLRFLCTHEATTDRLQENGPILKYGRLLREGDLFAYTSGERTPLEAEERKDMAFAAARVQAVKQGARLLYILARHQKVMRAAVERFSEWVAGRLAADFRMTAAAARERVATHVLVLTADGCDLWAPGFSFGLHQARDGHGKCVQRSSVRLPSDFSAEILHSDKAGQLTQHLLNFVRKTLEKPQGSKLTKRQREIYGETLGLLSRNESEAG